MESDLERFFARLSEVVAPENPNPEEVLADAVRLLSEFVKHYAPGTCKRCDPIYWEAVRWDLKRKGRSVPE